MTESFLRQQWKDYELATSLEHRPEVFWVLLLIRSLFIYLFFKVKMLQDTHTSGVIVPVCINCQSSHCQYGLASYKWRIRCVKQGVSK